MSKKKKKKRRGPDTRPSKTADFEGKEFLTASKPILPPSSGLAPESFVSRLLGLDLLSFAFLAGTGIAMMSINEFYAAGWFFISAAMALAFRLTTIVKTKRGYQRLLFAGAFSAVCGFAVNRVNDWEMSHSMVVNQSSAIKWIVYQRETHDSLNKGRSKSTEPNDRANLYVVNVRIRAYAPDEQTLKRWSSPDMFPFLTVRFPRTEAFIDIKNVGIYRALAPYIVRTAIIISNPLAPDEEDELFQQRPEWQSDGLVSIGNDWYPAETKRLHIFSNNGLLKPTDWPDLIAGKKVFYIVTRAMYQDNLGRLPEAVSCRWMSLVDDKVSLCWGHNN